MCRVCGMCETRRRWVLLIKNICLPFFILLLKGHVMSGRLDDKERSCFKLRWRHVIRIHKYVAIYIYITVRIQRHSLTFWHWMASLGWFPARTFSSTSKFDVQSKNNQLNTDPFNKHARRKNNYSGRILYCPAVIGTYTKCSRKCFHGFMVAFPFSVGSGW